MVFSFSPRAHFVIPLESMTLTPLIANGRIYDPRLGRFLQADPHIQNPLNTASLNRYSYVYNNPLNANDPSGYFVFTLAAAFLIAADVIATAYIALAVGIASFADALFQGASIREAFLSGVVGAFTAGVGGAVAASGTTLFGSQLAAQIVAMGVIGGIGSALQGGKFGHGFAAAGVSTLAGGILKGTKIMSKAVGRIITKSVIGGTISKLTGGKFGNGAASGAFSAIASEAGAASKSTFDSDSIPTAEVDTEALFDRSESLPEDSGSVAYDSGGDAYSRTAHRAPPEIIEVKVIAPRIYPSLTTGFADLVPIYHARIAAKHREFKIKQMEAELHANYNHGVQSARQLQNLAVGTVVGAPLAVAASPLVPAVVKYGVNVYRRIPQRVRTEIFRVTLELSVEGIGFATKTPTGTGIPHRTPYIYPRRAIPVLIR